MKASESVPSCNYEAERQKSRPLLSDSTHRERYYESATHNVNTPKRTGATSRACCFLLLLSVKFVGLVVEVAPSADTQILHPTTGVSADYAVKKLQQYSRRSTS